jgi:hypothetical protein
MADTSQLDLSHAGQLLFGSRFPHGLAGPAWKSELRAAFRKRALETHPDRAAVLRRSEAELAQKFDAICRAYELLEALPSAMAGSRADRHSAPPPQAPSKSTVRERSPCRPDHQHEGPVPRRPLRFAEYLYYSRRISFWTLAEAVTWQRRQRPAIGRIAIERGQLTSSQVAQVLDARRRDKAFQKPFGEYAIRCGFLTAEQLFVLLDRQRLLQKRIGEYFVAHGVLSQYEIQTARIDMQRHNSDQRA